MAWRGYWEQGSKSHAALEATTKLRPDVMSSGWASNSDKKSQEWGLGLNSTIKGRGRGDACFRYPSNVIPRTVSPCVSDCRL